MKCQVTTNWNERERERERGLVPIEIDLVQSSLEFVKNNYTTNKRTSPLNHVHPFLHVRNDCFQRFLLLPIGIVLFLFPTGRLPHIPSHINSWIHLGIWM